MIAELIINKIAKLNLSKVWFDVDGTTVTNGKLTTLGRWLSNNNLPIRINTIGVYTCAMLIKIGLNVIEHRHSEFGSTLEITEDGLYKKIIDKDEYLVDDEAVTNGTLLRYDE